MVTVIPVENSLGMSGSSEVVSRARSVVRVVLTGGPCGGKTMCQQAIKQELETRGIQCYFVPEIATLLLRGGCGLSDQPREVILEFQRQVMKLQLQLEDSFTAFAERIGAQALLLCDRGAVDGRCYLTDEEWEHQLEAQRLSAPKLEERYDAILFLVSAADGAEAHYGTASNEVRMESTEEARSLDERLRKCYVGHPHVRTFDNTVDFQTKTKRVIDCVLKLLEFPVEEDEVFHKFSVTDVPTVIPVHHTTETITLTFLADSTYAKHHDISRREKGKIAVLTEGTLHLRKGEESYHSRHITEETYDELFLEKSEQHHTVKLNVTFFQHNKKFWKLLEVNIADRPAAYYLVIHHIPIKEVPSIDFLPGVQEDVTGSFFHSLYNAAALQPDQTNTTTVLVEDF